MREKAETLWKPSDLTAAEDEVVDDDCRKRASTALSSAVGFGDGPDPIGLALEGLRPDAGSWSAAAGPDQPDLSGLDLSILEADGRDWSGFSVDLSLREDATMVALVDEDGFGQMIVPATGKALTRRELIADLLGVVVSNLNANLVLSGGDRLRQQDQVRRLVAALMSSSEPVSGPGVSGEAEALAEDTAELLLETMRRACRNLSRRPPQARS